MGKSDAFDAHQIAAATLGSPEEKLRRLRSGDGIRQEIRILATVRGSMTKDRPRSVSALVRSNDLGTGVRKKLAPAQIAGVSQRRTREEELSLTWMINLRPTRCSWKRQDSRRSVRRRSSPRGLAKAEFVTKQPSLPWRESTPSLPRLGTPSDADSTEAAVAP
ncbi:hypothetical protein [Corynebacterium sp. A21]|uniref:hypothetical protein n=1 Tax=Corynebacterium sp. A21 TaxID=3457318 RepID=UPI003FD14DAE